MANIIELFNLDHLKTEIQKLFPNSYVGFHKAALSSEKCCFFSFYQFSNKEDCESRLLDNNPIHVSLMLELLPNGKVSIEKNFIRFTTKPDNKYHAMGSRKIPYRKITGEVLKVEDKIIKTMKDIYKAFIEEYKADNLYYSIPEQYLPTELKGE